MTDTNIIIEVAKLDNFTLKHSVWTPCSEFCNCDLQEGHWIDGKYPAYLTSRDAIIPVIEKHLKTEKDWFNFFLYLGRESRERFPEQVHILVNYKLVLCATARALCIALLKATGNWKE